MLMWENTECDMLCLTINTSMKLDRGTVRLFAFSTCMETLGCKCLLDNQERIKIKTYYLDKNMTCILHVHMGSLFWIVSRTFRPRMASTSTRCAKPSSRRALWSSSLWLRRTRTRNTRRRSPSMSKNGLPSRSLSLCCEPTSRRLSTGNCTSHCRAVKMSFTHLN